MNGLLFSLPGTPVIYYGDEIGMGDNVYLGDRNGVRTPMQWSSRPQRRLLARPTAQRLYLPVVTDPEYHYEAVNVETQQANPQSLLWWMKRVIALRKKHPAFGRGTLDVPAPGQPPRPGLRPRARGRDHPGGGQPLALRAVDRAAPGRLRGPRARRAVRRGRVPAHRRRALPASASARTRSCGSDSPTTRPRPSCVRQRATCPSWPGAATSWRAPEAPQRRGRRRAAALDGVAALVPRRHAPGRRRARHRRACRCRPRRPPCSPSCRSATATPSRRPTCCRSPPTRTSTPTRCSAAAPEAAIARLVGEGGSTRLIDGTLVPGVFETLLGIVTGRRRHQGRTGRPGRPRAARACGRSWPAPSAAELAATPIREQPTMSNSSRGLRRPARAQALPRARGRTQPRPGAGPLPGRCRLRQRARGCSARPRSATAGRPATLAMVQAYVPHEGNLWESMREAVGAFLHDAEAEPEPPELAADGDRFFLELSRTRGARATRRDSIGVALRDRARAGRTRRARCTCCWPPPTPTDAGLRTRADVALPRALALPVGSTARQRRPRAARGDARLVAAARPGGGTRWCSRRRRASMRCWSVCATCTTDGAAHPRPRRPAPGPGARHRQRCGHHRLRGRHRRGP